MSKSDQSDQSQSETPELADRLVWWAVRVTIGWVIAGVAGLILSPFWAEPKWLAPNTLGDYLAGTFAPLALGWLVVATFLQKFELQAQREQLAQNGKALRMQAEELRASVVELQSQTEQMTRANLVATREGFIARREKEAETLASAILPRLNDLELISLSSVPVPGNSRMEVRMTHQFFSAEERTAAHEAAGRRNAVEFFSIVTRQAEALIRDLNTNLKYEAMSLETSKHCVQVAVRLLRGYVNRPVAETFNADDPGDPALTATVAAIGNALEKLEDLLEFLRRKTER